MTFASRLQLSTALLVTLGGCAAQGDEVPVTPEDEAITAVGARVLAGRSDLELASVRHSLTGSHARYRRLAPDGTRIVGAEVAVHQIGAPGQAKQVSVVDRQPAPVRLEGNRVITEGDAEARARAASPSGVIRDITVEAVALPTAQPTVVRAGYLAIVETREPAHEWEIWISGDGIAEVKRDRLQFVDGTGLVYDPNPIMQTGVLTLTDGNDATTPALDAARRSVTLPLLDGSGNLRGPWADSHRVSTRETSPTNTFNFDRSQDGFEEVMAYYHVTRVQQRLQSLGFTGLTGANARMQDLTVNEGNADNSFYSPSSKEISFGAGGVDDAEDADIIVHEYGHAVQDNIVPGWGSSNQAGAMGEGFGDLLAASLEPVDAGNSPMISRACVGAWDATSYDNASPPCLRRIDGTKHYPEGIQNQVHADGEIWSAGAWKLATDLGDVTLSLRLVVESFFLLQPDASFGEWADAMLAVDTALYAGAHLPAIKKALWDRGIYRVPAAPVTFAGTPATQATSLGTPAPLGNSVDDRITITHPGATRVRVNFSSFAMQTAAGCLDTFCDNVYVFDGTGTLYGIYGGAMGAFAGPIVPGDTVVVRYVTNRSGASGGFEINSYDHDSTLPPVDGGVPDAALPDAALPDAALPDAALPDAAVPDAAVPDAAIPDAAAPDAAPDAPVPDAAVGPDADDSGDGDGDGDDDDDDDGGCCGASGGDSSLVLGFLVLGLVLRRSRR